jgi:hypothetical protein
MPNNPAIQAVIAPVTNQPTTAAIIAAMIASA